MASSASTMEYLLDVLSDSHQVRARRMFGEYCVYYAGRPVGLVCDDQLYLKPSEAGRLLMKEMQTGAPFPGARPHLLINADYWDDRTWMSRLVRATFDSLPPPKPPKAPKVRMATSAKVATHDAAIQDLANLGPKSQEMLCAAGIATVAQLRKLGAVAAYVRVKQSSPRASLNLLWALEGALTDLPWQTVARDHRTSLLLALEQAAAAGPNARKAQTKTTNLPARKK
jgi:DNA transformation protein